MPNLERLNQLKITIIDFKIACSKEDIILPNGGGTVVVLNIHVKKKSNGY